MYSLVIFDLDDTLAESKSQILPPMQIALRDLLDHTKVAIISGGKYEQFQKQVIAHLPVGTRFKNLFLFPTCGSSYYKYEKYEWKNIYQDNLSIDEVENISNALISGQKESGITTEGTLYGEQIENRGSQVSWSALGQQCPSEVKATWDPDRTKRLQMLPYIERYIPEFEVRIGGSTTIDVTRKGIDKKYGIHQMEKYLGISLEHMFFIGDAIFPGGNDYAAVEAGIDYQKTTGPEMTLDIIRELIERIK